MFCEASAVTGESGFEESVVDSLVQSPPEELDSLLMALQEPLRSTEAPATVLSIVYERLAPQNARRDLGQFATPSFVSKFLAEWGITDADDSVLDPGIGAGQLSMHAVARKIELGDEEPLKEITGVDIDEVAIAMAAVSLKLVDGPGHPELIHNDFIRQSPRQFTARGHEAETYDAVVANPPYSRVQALNSRLRDDLDRVIMSETGYEFSQRTPLYGYFLAHAAQFLGIGGRLAAIVPSKFMDTKFGRDLKQYLLGEFTIHGVIQLADSIDVFDGVRARPSILLLEKGTPNTEHEVWFGKVKSWESTITPNSLLDSDKSDVNGVESVTTVAQELLVATERWSYYLDDTELSTFPELIRFDEIADISRGIATGHNDYFCLTQTEIKEYDIPQEYRRRLIRSAHGLTRVDLTKKAWKGWRDEGNAAWILYCYDEEGNVLSPEEIESEGVHDYLEVADELDTKDRHLVSGRDPWYRVESQEPAPILGKYMNRTGFLFMRNDADLLTLNNIHTIDLTFDWDQDQRDALLAYLNSRVVNRVLSKESHNYNGLQKIEISQLKQAPVIDPRRLGYRKRERLAILFEGLCEARDPSTDRSDADEILDQIDEVLEPLLGMADE
jgi:type I restriction-modification system DNA methylase subunit